MSIRRGFAVVLLMLTACDRSMDSAEAPSIHTTAVSMDAKADSTKDAPVTSVPPRSKRLVIRNAQLELRADSPDHVAAAAARLAEQVGGFVASSDTQGVGEQIHRIDASLRVPAIHFERVLADLRMEGDLLQETITGEDITEQHADIGARLRSQRALEERLLTILGRVESVEDALAVEAQLTTVRTEIERYEGTLRSMDDRVSLATITLVVQAPHRVNPAHAETVSSRLDRALDDAGRLAIGGLAGLIRALGALLPLMFVFGPLAFIGRRLWRRRRARAAAQRRVMAPTSGSFHVTPPPSARPPA
ncbi:MAG: DUF4349 domain-containing protein [Deltaproteobacteria bacterium]|nr:DUF4349 domain-containing protein [Deltaproteobacteria bacterium]